MFYNSINSRYKSRYKNRHPDLIVRCTKWKHVACVMSSLTKQKVFNAVYVSGGLANIVKAFGKYSPMERDVAGSVRHLNKKRK